MSDDDPPIPKRQKPSSLFIVGYIILPMKSDKRKTILVGPRAYHSDIHSGIG
jgi:hypothetical protein